MSPYFSPALWGSQSWLDSVGINRRGVVNERVIQERSSNHPGPEPCEGSRKAALEALDRGICRLGIELRNPTVQGADGVRLQGRQQRVARQRECGAALRSRRPQACGETPCARTGRP